jgi:hypothetical protein
MHQNVGNIIPRSISILINDDPVASTGTITWDNAVAIANNDTVVVNGRTYTFKTTLTGAVDEVLIQTGGDDALANLRALINSGRASVSAGGVLTSDNVLPTNNDQVVIGAKTYVMKSTLTEVKAGGVLTSDQTNPAEGNKVVVGNITYIFTESLSSFMPNYVKIGATAIVTMANLVKAINKDAGISVAYGIGTEANPDFTAVHTSDYVVTVSAIIPGLAGNAFAKTETSSHLDWDGSGSVMTGGIASVANEVKIGADANATLQNLKDACNGTGTKGTQYSYVTVASTEILAGAIDTGTHALTVSAILAGTAGNSLAKTENSTHLDWDGAGAVMTGGVVESVVNVSVTCSAVVAHVITLTAITAGLAGNALTLDETSAHLAKSGAVFTGGGSTIGTATIEGEGGRISQIITDCPQFTGTPTYTITIKNSGGNVLYLSGAQTENTVTRTAVEMTLAPTDTILITTNAKVEETLPVVVTFR